MKKLLSKLEALMAAVAFAEEGEVEAARQIVAEAGAAEPAGQGGKPDDSSPGLYGDRVAKASRA